MTRMVRAFGAIAFAAAAAAGVLALNGEPTWDVPPAEVHAAPVEPTWDFTPAGVREPTWDSAPLDFGA
ncbi:hypothetical protein GCM10010305_46160 [Streptomyces termitum]|uniref:Uncharacterized protein n=1 Tax=Streptomyces termitum TaxID=67368 RepID=A0A918WCU9_9ACTN|nr:hypothetical protein GCM10010305_46160 [Streptomyces termitum]